MRNSGKKKIVVIDDSETNLLLLQAILEDAGYEVKLLDNSSTTVDYIKEWKPDLILIDLLMPDMDGFDFLKLLSNGSGTQPSPVLVVTAYSDLDNNQKARALGAMDVISKPIDISSFLMRVNQIVN